MREPLTNFIFIAVAHQSEKVVNNNSPSHFMLCHFSNKRKEIRNMLFLRMDESSIAKWRLLSLNMPIISSY